MCKDEMSTEERRRIAEKIIWDDRVDYSLPDRKSSSYDRIGPQRMMDETEDTWLQRCQNGERYWDNH